MNSRAKATMPVSLLILFASTLALPAQTIPAAAMAKAVTVAPAQPVITRTIIVSLADHRLALVENGVVKAVYPVAVGKTSTPSPTGTFTIANRVTNPTYYHSGRVIPPGPRNPVGNRWMGLSIAGYGIHGTNEPWSVGRAVSHGCIRLGRRDLEKLFAQVRIGDTVEIVGERDAQTVAIFGGPAVPLSAPAPVLTAKNTPATAPAETASLTDSVAPASR